MILYVSLTAILTAAFLLGIVVGVWSERQEDEQDKKKRTAELLQRQRKDKEEKHIKKIG